MIMYTPPLLSDPSLLFTNAAMNQVGVSVRARVDQLTVTSECISDACVTCGLLQCRMQGVIYALFHAIL